MIMKGKLIKVAEGLKDMAATFTLVYMWAACCHYAFSHINYIGGQACFYGGLATAILWVLTSPSMKKVRGSK